MGHNIQSLIMQLVSALTLCLLFQTPASGTPMETARSLSVSHHSSLFSHHTATVDLEKQQWQAAERILEEAQEMMEKENTDTLDAWSLHAHRLVSVLTH